MQQTFSPIQNHILSKLKNAKSLRYSEMQPKKTPNDLFNYHLQFLVKKGFVERHGDKGEKGGEGYSLSPLGVKHVADPYPAGVTPEITSLFKSNVITIVSREFDGKLQILNQVRASNPSRGKVGVMGGVIRKGETTEAAAKRKLQAETGLIADFRLVAIERRILFTEEGLFSDVYFPIAYASSYSGTLIDTQFGKNMWVDIDKAIKNESAEFDSIKSITRVLKAIKDGTISKMPFFYSEDVKEGSISEML